MPRYGLEIISGSITASRIGLTFRQPPVGERWNARANVFWSSSNSRGRVHPQYYNVSSDGQRSNGSVNPRILPVEGNTVSFNGLEANTTYTLTYREDLAWFSGGSGGIATGERECTLSITATTLPMELIVSGPRVIYYMEVDRVTYTVDETRLSRASLAYALAPSDQTDFNGFNIRMRLNRRTFESDDGTVLGVMGWTGAFGRGCREEYNGPGYAFREFTFRYTTFSPNVCANIPGLDTTVGVEVRVQGRAGGNTQIVNLLSTSFIVRLIGTHPEATSRPPHLPCTGAYYAFGWSVAQERLFGVRFTNYSVSYSVRGFGTTNVRVGNRFTTTYQVSGLSGVSVGDEITFAVTASYPYEDDDGNQQGSSRTVGDGMGTMQPCTPVEVVVNPPFDITFDICTDAAVRMIWSRPSVQSGYSLLRYDWELHTNPSYTNRVRFQSSTNDISTFSRYWVRYTTLTPGVTYYGRVRVVVTVQGQTQEFTSSWANASNSCTVPGICGKYPNAYQDPHQYGICGKYPNAYQDPHQNAYQNAYQDSDRRYGDYLPAAAQYDFQPVRCQQSCHPLQL